MADNRPGRCGMPPSTAVVFDMDGVLVDPTQSYRQSVIETVVAMGGRRLTFADIEDYKNQGGWNNDWMLSQRILRDHGIEAAYEDVIERFNAIFFGANGDGLVLREEWLVNDDLFSRLAQRHRLSIFTGRRRCDAQITLHRFAPHWRFAPVVCMEDVENHKPAPDGLFRIQEELPGTKLFFLGDTIDDARSAKDAGVAFFGVASKRNPRRAELIDVLNAQGALAILENVNEVEAAIDALIGSDGR